MRPDPGLACSFASIFRTVFGWQRMYAAASLTPIQDDCESGGVLHSGKCPRVSKCSEIDCRTARAIEGRKISASTSIAFCGSSIEMFLVIGSVNRKHHFRAHILPTPLRWEPSSSGKFRQGLARRTIDFPLTCMVITVRVRLGAQKLSIRTCRSKLFFGG